VTAALRNRDFRILWIGLLVSSIGTWMQNLILPAYVDDRTRSAAWVGAFIFAQLGPLLLLSIVGGMVADRLPRRPWMVTLQTVQLLMTVAIAWAVADDLSLWVLLMVQVMIGVANALNAPAMQGTMPNLVDPRDLPGAISLNSAMINGSRVLGPVLAAVLIGFGMNMPGVLLVNAATYLFVIVALLIIRMPPRQPVAEVRGWENFMLGIRIATRRSALARLLLTLAIFSFVCLPYVGLFPTVTRVNLGIESTGSQYKQLYAVWGLGAMVGSLSIGTVFARADKQALLVHFMRAFAVSLAVFALLRSPAPAYPVGFVLGFCYFAMTTSMMTVLQENLLPAERPRVMSLWFMAFGGTVAIGNLVFGPIMDLVRPTAVMLIGVLAALWLAWWCDLRHRQVVTLADEPASDDSASHGVAQGGGDGTHSRHQTPFDEHGISAGD
jgi:MFS family permease